MHCLSNTHTFSPSLSHTHTYAILSHACTHCLSQTHKQTHKHKHKHSEIPSRRWIHKQCLWIPDSTNLQAQSLRLSYTITLSHFLSRSPSISHTHTDILRFHQEENCEPKLPTARQASIEVLHVYMHIHIHTCICIYRYLYYVYIDIYMYLCTCTRVHVFIYCRPFIKFPLRCVGVLIVYAYIFADIHVHLCVYTHLYVHM